MPKGRSQVFQMNRNERLLGEPISGTLWDNPLHTPFPILFLFEAQDLAIGEALRGMPR